MFASTQADHSKAKAVSESVREALEHGQFSSAISVVLGRGKHQNDRTPVHADEVSKDSKPEKVPPPGTQPADLNKSLATLQQALDKELKEGKVGLRLEARGLVISLREAAFFASGEDVVALPSIPTLEKMARVVVDLPNPVRLEGHTDAIPIHTSRFRSNWELSAARGIAMMELLHGYFKVPYERMSVAAYAENAPDDTNETDEGRAHNRRVDVVLLSAEGLRGEPVASPVSTKP
jgi:chemotaxis protein MotB